MSVQVVDKPLLRRRLTRAHRRNAPGALFLLDAVGAELAERLSGVERRFPLAVAFAGQTDRFAAALSATGKIEHVCRLEQVEAALQASELPGAVADEEALPLGPRTIDLFVSPLALQWTNDLPGALIQIRQALRPDGLLLAAMAGGRTLGELRESLTAAETELRGGAGPRILPTTEVRDMGALLLRAGFALPVADRDTLTVRYDTAFQLLADLKAMGATNVLLDRDRRPSGRAFFKRAAEIYAERFSDADGRIRASFEIVHLSGWAPHESQQKPAKRGSAEIRLADVLRSPNRPGRSAD